MANKKIAGLLAAGAVIALATLPAQAQIYGPGPMPPARVDIYQGTPQADPGDYNWSARQNVADSDRYERLLKASPSFRDYRIRKECGSISEPDLYQQCIATFR